MHMQVARKAVNNTYGPQDPLSVPCHETPMNNIFQKFCGFVVSAHLFVSHPHLIINSSHFMVLAAVGN